MGHSSTFIGDVLLPALSWLRSSCVLRSGDGDDGGGDESSCSWTSDILDREVWPESPNRDRNASGDSSDAGLKVGDIGVGAAVGARELITESGCSRFMRGDGLKCPHFGQTYSERGKRSG